MTNQTNKTPLLEAGAPQPINMNESPCAIAAAKRAGYTIAGGIIGAGIGSATCGTGIGAAIQAGLCFLAGPETASCCCDCCSKCDNMDDNFAVDPKALALSFPIHRRFSA